MQVHFYEEIKQGLSEKLTAHYRLLIFNNALHSELNQSLSDWKFLNLPILLKSLEHTLTRIWNN